MIFRFPSGHSLIIDDEDSHLLNIKWHLVRHKKSGEKLYVQSALKGRTVKIHRLILGLNNKDKNVVDHRNGNTLDNRKQNLRICTTAQNAWNQSLRSNNVSGYKGVSYVKRKKRYCATIGFNGQNIWLGFHNSKEMAAVAYDNKAKELYGDFAKLNFS